MKGKGYKTNKMKVKLKGILYALVRWGFIVKFWVLNLLRLIIVSIKEISSGKYQKAYK